MKIAMTTNGLACLAIVASGFAAAAPAQAQERVRVAYQPLVAIPQGAMKREGWFEEATGATVEWLNFSSGGDVNTAFAAGEVDIGLVGLPAYVSGVAQGIPYKLIMLYDIPGTMSGLAVQEGSGIETIADLKGKRVGVTFGSGADYMLQGVLAENGLSVNDLTLVNLQPQPIVAAWATKQIDAAYIWAPILTELQAQGGTLITDDGEMAKLGYFAGDVGLVSNTFAEEHPELVQAWVEQNLRAVDWFNANGPGAHDAMIAEYELTAEQLPLVALPPAVVYPTRDEQLDPQWFGNGAASMVESSVRIGEFLKENKLISEAPTAEQLSAATDASFLEKATVPAAPQ